ncbi:MAG: hypothetical protein WKG01_12710 [Kofleriaceae bacterium]
MYWLPDMLDIEAIETINFEQLVTVTDRLLLKGRTTERRLSTNKLIFRSELAEAARRSSQHFELTHIVSRPTPRLDTPSLAVIATLLSIVLLLALQL